MDIVIVAVVNGTIQLKACVVSICNLLSSCATKSAQESGGWNNLKTKP